jgi:thiol reductant ABC exporter CydC subunit
MNRTGTPSSAWWAIAGGAASAASGIGLLATSGWLITTASLRPPILSLTIAIGAVQAFALARGVARYLERLAVHDSALRRLGSLRLGLFDTLEPLVPGGLGRTTTGSLLSSYVADTDAVAMASARRLLATVDVGAALVLGVVLAALVDPRCAFVLLAGATTALAGSTAASALDRRAAEREAAVRAAVVDAALEAAGAALELAAYGRSDLVSSRLDALAARSAAAARRRALVAGIARGWIVLAASASLLAVVATGLAEHRAQRLSGVWLAVVVFDALAVLEVCTQLPDALAATRAGSAARSRLEDLRRRRPPCAEPAQPLAPPPRPAAATLSGAAATGDDGTVMLPALDLTVAPGRRVALVGPSGSGKSTALHLLLAFRRPSSGRAQIGGVEPDRLGRRALADRLAWVPEDPHLFAASLEDNLRIAAPSATTGQLAAALEQVGLGPWLAALPDGWTTRLGSGGRPVSAGERQRLAVARALLAQPDLLLLDEPTAHLDPETAHRMLASLAGLAASWPRAPGMLVASHDPAARAFADEVVELGRSERPGPNATGIGQESS